MSENPPSAKKKHWRWVALGVIGLFALWSFVPTTGTKPNCLLSETLRVEIGGEKFAFPRKFLVHLRGSDVKNVQDPNDTGASPDKACQSTADAIWHVSEMHTVLRFKPCPANRPNCMSNQISVSVEDLAARRRGTALDVYPKTKEQLMKICKPSYEPYDKSQPQYWANCSFLFEDAGLFFSIRFNGEKEMHPPEEIEATKASVMQAIRQYHIK